MWLGSGEHTVKKGMIELDQERLGIIQSLEMGNVASKLKTQSNKE